MTGDRDKARELVCGALALQTHGGYWLEAISTMETLAGIHAIDGDFLRAARLVGAATAARHWLGARRCRLDDLRHRAERAVLAGAIDRTALRAALRDGAALTLEEAIAYALRGRGVRTRRTNGWDSLTPTELMIAELVAGGHSNPAIGQRIFVSRATVKAHLARVYAKTGIATRAELAAEAIRHSTLPGNR